MATLTRSRPRSKPNRSIRLALPFGDSPHNMAAVVITVGQEATDYAVTRIPADFGTAFEVSKLFSPDAERYHVNLNGPESICSCKGHLRHGHCKHVSGLLALQKAGKL